MTISNNVTPVDLYNITYKSYDKLYREEQYSKYEYIIRKGIIPRGLVLDIGCGTGLLVEFLINNKIDSFKQYICLEPSHGMISVLIKKTFTRDPRIIVIQGYAEQLPFPPQSFDVIYMITVWDNLTQKSKVIEEVKRVIKRNGHIIISLLARHGLEHSIRHFIKIVNEKGFTVIDKGDYRGEHFFQLVLKN